MAFRKPKKEVLELGRRDPYRNGYIKVSHDGYSASDGDPASTTYDVVNPINKHPQGLVNVPIVGDFEHHQTKYLLEMKYPQELGDVKNRDIYQPLIPAEIAGVKTIPN